MKLSLCMIVRNERFFIDNCLRAAAPHVDEIVIVDTGSTDGTRDIAAQFTDQIIETEWTHDFSAARNLGLEGASGDWILVLDADELIVPDDYRTLRSHMDAEGVEGYYLHQKTYTNEQSAGNWRPASDTDTKLSRGYEGYFLNPILRLFKNRPSTRYQGRIHEIVDGTIPEHSRGDAGVAIHHYTSLNPDRPKQDREDYYLSLMEQEIAENPTGRLLAIAGKSLMWHRGEFHKAHQYLLRAAAMGYKRDKTLEEAAEAAYRMGNHGTAMDIYRQLYSDGYRSATICLHMANLLVRAGDKDDAIRLLEESIALGGFGPEIIATIRRNIAFLSSSSR